MEELKPLELNKNILFLLSRVDQIPHVEVYLRKRDWNLKLTSSLKEAVAFLVENKPSYFFISYDFPNKKALNIAKSPALDQMTNIILTGEVSKPNTLKGIQEFRVKYKLQPPMSGPGIERIINKIVRDLEKQDHDIRESIKKGTLTKDQEKIIKIRSSQNNQIGDTFIQAGGGIGELLTAMVSEEDDSKELNLLNNQASGSLDLEEKMFEEASSVTFDPQKPAALDLEALKNYSKNDLDLGLENLKKINHENGEHFDQQVASNVKNNFNKIKNNALQRKQQKSSGSSEKINQLDQMKDIFRKAAARALGLDENSEDLDLNKLSQLSKDKFKKALDEISKTNKLDLADDILRNFDYLKQEAIEKQQNKKKSIEYSHAHNSFNLIPQSTKNKRGKMTLIETGSHVASDTTFLKQRHQKSFKHIISQKSKVSCIHIESEAYKGYLLVSYSKERSFDETLIQQMKKKLSEFMKMNGVSIKDNELMTLSMSEVDFEDWAVDQAEFLKNTNHQGEDIAVAFFPDNKDFEELKERTLLKKLEMSIDELRGDLVVEFDLHMYLEKNKKLIKYTEKGRTFYSNQKTRLVEKGMKNLYISPEAKSDLKKYRVQNYLNDKIEEFKKKTKMRGVG